jgi:hypothetical protein
VDNIVVKRVHLIGQLKLSLHELQVCKKRGDVLTVPTRDKADIRPCDGSQSDTSITCSFLTSALSFGEQGVDEFGVYWMQDCYNVILITKLRLVEKVHSFKAPEIILHREELRFHFFCASHRSNDLV